MNSKHPRTDKKVADMIARDQSYRTAAEGLEFWARQLEEELAESKERERVAIASWDEERQRALREAARVVAANRLLDEAFGFVNPPLADSIADYLTRTGAIKYL